MILIKLAKMVMILQKRFLLKIRLQLPAKNAIQTSMQTDMLMNGMAIQPTLKTATLWNIPMVQRK